MSVVVQMEMPSCCHDCPFEADQWDYPICRVTGRSEGYRFDERNNRMVDCPIICQLPEGHGRLVDISPLDVIAFRDKDCSFYAGVLSVCERIDKLPTIVPADTAERSEA